MTDSTWPPSEGLCTPTVARENGILSLSTSIHIKAPASRVLDILLDVSKYPEWNTWVPRVTITSQPPSAENSHTLHVGTAFTFHVIMNDSKPQSETPTLLKVTDISTPSQPSSYISTETLEKDPTYTADLSRVYRVAWKGEGGLVSRGLSTERFHEVLVRGDGECEVRTWEVMGGILARTVKWMYQKTLSDKFDLWCADLKKYAEQQAS